MRNVEIWRDISDYQGMYQISNQGRVKSLKYGKERIMRLSYDSRNYLLVKLYRNCISNSIYIHKCVYDHFNYHLGNNGIIKHIDGNKCNNNASNLVRLSNSSYDTSVTIDSEVWKNIDRFDGYYQISNRGRIKSLKLNREKILSVYVNAYGYHVSTISHNGGVSKVFMHKEVYKAFNGVLLKGQTIHHIDGCKINNSNDNLIILKRSEHSKEHNNSRRRLSKKEAIQVKMLLKLSVYTINEIANKYGVDHITISRIKNTNTKVSLGI